MDVNDVTIGQLKELMRMSVLGHPSVQDDDSHWRLGACYLIRTVTMIQTGLLVKVTPHELVLEDAAWIADTGRFSDALVSLDFNEVEPFPDGQVIVGRGALIDAVVISSTPRKQK